MIIDASLVKMKHLWHPEMYSVAAVLRTFLARLEVGDEIIVEEIRDKNACYVPLHNIRTAASKMKNKKFTIRTVERKSNKGLRVRRIA